MFPADTRPTRGRSRTFTSLHHAAAEGSTERTFALLNTGSINIDQGDVNGWTPLMLAAFRGHSRVVRILMNRGASVSVGSDSGFTALHSSAQEGHIAVSTLLVKAGVDLDAADFKGSTPLHVAVANGHWQVVQVLAEAGANPNSHKVGFTPLFLAARFGHLEVVKQLLRASADPLLTSTVRLPGDEPCLPLDAAARSGRSQVVRELILQVGIKGCGGASAGLDALDQASQVPHMGIMAMLADAGVVDTGKVLGEAIMFGLTTSTKSLVQHYQQGNPAGIAAYVNNTSHHTGYTPLMLSMGSLLSCSRGIAQLLVRAGADTTLAVRVTNIAGEARNDTPLDVIDYLSNMLSNNKDKGEEKRTEEKLYTLKAKRRLLSRVEAVHAVSWLWHNGVARISHIADGEIATETATTTGTPLGATLPILRRRARRRGVLLSALFR